MTTTPNRKVAQRKAKSWFIPVALVLIVLLVIVYAVFRPSDKNDTLISKEVEALRSAPAAPTATATIVPTPPATNEQSTETWASEPVVTEGAYGDTTVPVTGSGGDYVEVQDYSQVADRPPYNTADIANSKGKNYVLIGSDSRDGSNTAVAGDGVTGQRSDVTMVLHISEDKSRTDIVSIPRDTMVYLPECYLSNGAVTPSQTASMFNNAFSQGDTVASAVACTMRTIEANTGVRMDGYAVVDFAGFQNVIDALGGITIEVPERMVSSKAGLDVQPGVQVMDGATALAYSRARIFETGGGDGSDLSRIGRQQQVLSAIMERLFSVSSVINPVGTYNAFTAIQDSVLLSDDLNFVFGQVQFLRAGSGERNFYTTPTVPYTYDYNRVMWTQDAMLLWQNMHDDKPLS